MTVGEERTNVSTVLFGELLRHNSLLGQLKPCRKPCLAMNMFSSILAMIEQALMCYARLDMLSGVIRGDGKTMRQGGCVLLYERA